MPTTFPSTVDRDITEYLGENLSVLAYGAVGDSITDDAPAINAAITALSGLGGRKLYIPGGRTYLIKSPIVFASGTANLTLFGDGDSTVIKRGANMTAGMGVFDIQGSAKITFKDFKVDGNVTTSVGLLYGGTGVGDFNNDPMHATLTTNTSFWIHGGSSKIRFRGVTVTHTGGYSILASAVSVGDIDDVRITDCLFENNRPNLFGTSSGDKTYGSWTGGVHFQSDGTSYATKNVLIENNTFRRVTGNCVWTHLYSLTKLHSNFRVLGNHFEDTGLDGVLMGGVIGGLVKGNTFRRIGYIAADDVAVPAPKYLANFYAVAIDTAGLTRGVNYVDNTIISANGGCMDLDGFSQGTVSGNTCIIPSVGEAQYTEDQIGSSAWGVSATTNHNWVYGAQTSNTNNDPLAGSDVLITANTFINMSGGAIKLYAARNSTASNNNIIHADDANGVPIVLGNIGTGPYQRAYDNVVSDNQIKWSPASNAPAVYEDNQYGNFDPADKNWITSNRISGNGKCFEFQKNITTLSISGRTFNTNISTVATEQSATLQFEGTGASGALKVYTKNNTTTAQLAQFQSTNRGLNLGNGVATGFIGTGLHVSAAWGDSILTSKPGATGFLYLMDKANVASTYSDTDADVLTATWGELRNNAGVLEWSGSVSAGHRVWGAVSTGATATSAGAAGQVQYAGASSTFAASANFAWDNVLKRLTIAGLTGTAGIVSTTSFIQADEGFYTTSGSASAVNVPSGGVTALSLISVRNDGAAGLTLVRTTATAHQYGLGINSSGTFFLSDMTAATNRLTMDTAGLITIGTSVQINQAGAVSMTGVLTASGSAAGVNVTGNSAYNNIQTSGGVLANQYTIQDTVGSVVAYQLTGIFNPGLSNRTYFYTPIWIKNSAYDALQIFQCSNANPAVISAWGGVHCGQLTLESLISSQLPVAPTGTQAAIWNDSGVLYGRNNTGAAVALLGGGTGAITGITGTANQVVASSPTGAVNLSLAVDVAVGSAAGSTGTVTVYSTLSNAVQAPNGGITAGYLSATGQTNPSSGTNHAVLSAKQLRMQQTAGDDPAAGVIDYRGYDTAALNIVGAGTATGNRLIHLWDNVLVGRALTVTGVASSASLAITNGFIDSAEGFHTASTLTNCIQAPTGGVTARYLITTDSLFFIAEAQPAAPSAGQAKLYFDSTTSKLMANEGTGWVTVISTATAASLPLLDTTHTYPAGITTEVSVSLIDMGINDVRFGTQTVGSPGGFLRLDARGGGNVFYSLFGRAAGVTAPLAIATVNDQGQTRFGVTTTNLANTNRGMSIMDDAANVSVALGQSLSASFGFVWNYNANPALGYASFYTFGYGTPLLIGASYIQFNSGNVGIGVAPSFPLDVNGTARVTKLLLSGTSGNIIDSPSSVFSVNPAGAVSIAGVLTSAAGVNVTSVTSFNSIQTTGGVLGKSGLFSQKDGGLGYVLADGYGVGCFGQIQTRSARGSLAGPQPLQNADVIGVFDASGWWNGASAFPVNGQAAMIMQAIMPGAFGTPWSNVSQGARILFYTTPTTSASRLLRLVIQEDGAVTVSGVAAASSFNVSAGYITSSEGGTSTTGKWRGAQHTFTDGATAVERAGFRYSGGSIQYCNDVTVGSPVWIGLSGVGGAAAGTTQQIQFNNAGSFGASSQLTFDGTFLNANTLRLRGNDSNQIYESTAGVTLRMSSQSGSIVLAPSLTDRFSINTAGVAQFTNQLVVGGAAGGAGITISNGYCLSSEGFATSNGSFQSFKNTSGGMNALSFTAIRYMQVGQNSGTPAAVSGDSIGNGAMYYDTSTGKLRVMLGGVFTDVATGTTGGGAVSSVNGSGGISVSPTTGSVTVSLNSLASVVFSNITSSNAIQASATGGSITFQNTNTNFQINGNGTISTVSFINCAGVVSSAGIQATGYNVTGGFIGQTVTVVGSFTISGIARTQLIYRGGVLVSYA